MNIRLAATAAKSTVAAGALVFTAVSPVSPSGYLHWNSAQSIAGLHHNSSPQPPAPSVRADDKPVLYFQVDSPESAEPESRPASGQSPDLYYHI